MGEGNMICPRCRSFQPAAATCRECGVVVEKLWARRRATKQERPRRRTGIADRAAVAIAAVAALGAVAWGLLAPAPTSSPGPEAAPPSFMDPYRRAAEEAQRHARNAEARMRAAAEAMERGESSVLATAGRALVPVPELNLDLDDLAAQIDAVEDDRVVDLRGEDLRPTVERCARLTQRYFPVLSYAKHDEYPLPAPATRRYEAEGRYTRVMCDGPDGRIYRSTPPRDRGESSACWLRQRGFGRPGRPAEQRDEWIWVQMQWDPEMARWAIYSMAQQRLVDRSRLEDVRQALPADIIERQSAREQAARERIPVMGGDVLRLREQLRVAASRHRRGELTRRLLERERLLRRTLVEARYSQICRRAAGAALEHLARTLR